MEKNRRIAFGGSPHWRKILLRAVACLILAVAAPRGAIAQNAADTSPKVTLNVRQVTFASAVEQLRKQTGYEFVFNSADVANLGTVTLNLPSGTLKQAMDRMLDKTGLTYTISGKTVVIRRASVAQAAGGAAVVSGTVKNMHKEPIAGVSIRVKGTVIGATSSNDGSFRLTFPKADNTVIVFSVLGMRSQEIAYKGESTLNVVLEEETAQVEEVIVTGIVDRRASISTGASQTLTIDELRKVGGTNILQSLSNIDPSFRLVENLAQGSNPNAIPDIQLRGQSGFPDLKGEYSVNPNQPLFILDGFEVSATKVMDMDMNRVASVTLLKDAAAKAIYGAKAANGVVVIETHRPAPGKMQVTYTGRADISVPDLSSYNLCNAWEKLQIEKMAGLYTYKSSIYDYPDRQYPFDMGYDEVLNEVLRGVDTYWLSKPLQTGVGQKHSLFLEGGDEYLRYGFDFSYNDVKGTMKGSDRQTVSGGITLSYRYKNILFRDNLEVAYNKGTNSPWGTFSQYALMNPYFRPTDENGNITKVAGSTYITGQVGNPMWNSTINTKDFTEYTEITNNFYAEWTPLDGLKVTGRVGLTKNDPGSEVFHPASHTDFLTYTTPEQVSRKGRYTYGDGREMHIYSDVNGNYAKQIGRHFLFLNLGWSLDSQSSHFTNFVAEGFPNDYMDDILFASKYLKDGFPTGSESATRNIGLLGIFDYSYGNRYLFNASYRRSGSSQFGRDNRWGTFWSIGLGWNLHNETFMQDIEFLDQLKIRGSVGYTGSQNFSSYLSKATYTYSLTETYLDNHGAYLMGVSNDRLKWQRKYDQNVGVDLAMFNKRLNVRFDYYVSNTDDLLTDVTIPSSTGFLSYKENLGKVQNVGQEFRISYQVWKNLRGDFVNLYVAGTHNKNTIKEISNSLNTFNKEQEASGSTRPIVRYIEGQSMSVIWAVPSYGIDPASGRDIFIRRDGSVTHVWNSNDLAVCGDTEPELRGNMGFNIDFRGFSLNVGMNYMFGGQIYNQTLVDKVENASPKSNVDRRFFTDRWQKPGDIARFKNITHTDRTQATQRFVEDRDEFSLSSLNFSYDFNRIEAIKRAGLDRLRLSFDMNDVWLVSSVRIERGTSYPFARTFAFSLQAMF